MQPYERIDEQPVPAFEHDRSSDPDNRQRRRGKRGGTVDLGARARRHRNRLRRSPAPRAQPEDDAGDDAQQPAEPAQSASAQQLPAVQMSLQQKSEVLAAQAPLALQAELTQVPVWDWPVVGSQIVADP